MDKQVIVTIIFSFLMSFSIGANNSANGLATSYGSQAMRLRYLIVIGSIVEFIGAHFCSYEDDINLSGDVIPDLDELSDDQQKKMMFAVCLSCFIFIFTSTIFSIPISVTDTIVGALLGAGIEATGINNVDSQKLIEIIILLFVSPVASAILSMIWMTIVTKLTLDTAHISYQSRIYFMQAISSIYFMVIGAILDTILEKDHTFLWQFVLIGFYLGIVICRIIMLINIIIMTELDQIGKFNIFYYVVVSIFMPWKTDHIQKLTLTLNVLSTVELNDYSYAKYKGSDLSIFHTQSTNRGNSLFQFQMPQSMENFQHQRLTQHLSEIKTKMGNQKDNAGTLYPQISFCAKINFDNNDFKKYIHFIMGPTHMEANNKKQQIIIQSESASKNVLVIPELIEEIDGTDDKRESTQSNNRLSSSINEELMPPTPNALSKQQNQINGFSIEIHKYFYQQAMMTCEVYRFMMVVSAFLVCLSHGSHNVANAISPLIIVMDTIKKPVYYSFLIGAAGIAFGLMILGYRVIQTVGKNIIILDFQKGFCAQFATATCVCLGSLTGISLSTTQCMIGSLVGVHLISKTQFCKNIYWAKKQKPSNIQLNDKNKDQISEIELAHYEALRINMKTIYKIMFMWIITIPCSLGITIIILKFIY